MVTHHLISFIICAVLCFVLTRSDFKKNSVTLRGETYLPTRFRWRTTLGNTLGICAGIILLKLFRIWVG